MILEVLNQNDANIFCKQIKKPQPSIVLFYAEWCPACHNMLPDWNAFQNEMNDNNHQIDNQINIFKIESSNFGLLDFEPDIMGYPTIRKYVNNKSEEFMEPERNTESFKKFLGLDNLKSINKPNKKPTKKPTKKSTKKSSKKSTKKPTKKSTKKSSKKSTKKSSKK